MSLRPLFLSIFEWPFYTGFTVYYVPLFNFVSQPIKVGFGGGGGGGGRPDREGGIRTSLSIPQVLRIYAHQRKTLIHFPIGILGQVWYLIVSIPDLCTLTYFNYSNGQEVS